MPEQKKANTNRTEDRDTYTVSEVAHKLGISRLSGYMAVDRGEIPHIRVGRRILIPKVAFDHLLSTPRPKTAA